MSAVPVNAGFRDFSFGSSCSSTPSGEKPESKLWYNDGFWWGSLCTPSNVHHIHRLDLGTQAWVDTGVELDPRPTSKADTLWDGQKLYVVSGVFVSSGSSTSNSSRWSRLYRYSYNTATDTYSLDSGFPVNVSRGRPEAITVAKDSTGTLWVTYTESSRVKINHSIGGNDANWGTPFDLPVPNATGLTSDDISAVIAYQGQIGVMWSNQITDDFHFAVHRDGDGDAAADWQSGIANTSTGNFADDHINLKSLPGSDPAGTVFAVVKTSYTSGPLIVLLVCTSTSNYGCASLNNWQEHVVYLASDDSTGAILAIDTSGRVLHVLSSFPETGGQIQDKATDLDNIQFPAGAGTVVIDNLPVDTRTNNASSSKHTVDATTGLTVIASDQLTRFYLHNHLSLGGTPVPDIGVSPTSHNYGSVVVGTSVSQTFVMSNTGTADLSVSATTLGGMDPGQFSIVSGGGAFTLTPGQTRDLMVSFNPSSRGAALGDGGGVGPRHRGDADESRLRERGGRGQCLADLRGEQHGHGRSGRQRDDAGRNGSRAVQHCQWWGSLHPDAWADSRSRGELQLSVTNGAGTGTSATNFTVTALPVIDSFTPTSGPVGTSVTLSGSNFTGTTDVQFNGVSVGTNFTVNSDTSITTSVPTGATTGPISVTNGAGTGTSTTDFTVTTAP